MRTSIVLTLLVGLLIGNDAFSQRRKVRVQRAIENGWTALGSKKVNWRVEKDVLHVGANDGRFAKLRIKVTNGSINMRRMVVTYGNGTKDEIQLKHHFRQGSESRTIDLNGGKRIIKHITFIYDSKNMGRKATVWVAGKR